MTDLEFFIIQRRLQETPVCPVAQFSQCFGSSDPDSFFPVREEWRNGGSGTRVPEFTECPDCPLPDPAIRIVQALHEGIIRPGVPDSSKGPERNPDHVRDRV
jgi:hypothetical protein